MLLRGLGLICTLLMMPVLACANPINTGQQDPWAIWKQPGVHAVMRHATAPGTGDPEGFTLGVCSTQRNLSTAGRAEARAFGQRIRSKGVRISKVYSSQWCRCMHTAQELALGEAVELPALNSFFQERDKSGEQTQALLAFVEQLQSKDNALFVTHQVNITSLTGVYPSPGEVVLFRVENGRVKVLGQIETNPAR